MKCLGNLCPPSLEAINTPKFVIRAGIIPYAIPQQMILLGVKEGKYTDFGGGCKVAKMELPFDCAVREMREEAGSEIVPNLDNITHLFISGKRQPHQVVLMVKIDDLHLPRQIPKGELERVELLSFARFRKIEHFRLADSLKSIYKDILVAMSTM